MIIIRKHLVLTKRKLQDIISHPLETGIRPGPETFDKRNPRKRENQKAEKLHPLKRLDCSKKSPQRS